MTFAPGQNWNAYNAALRDRRASGRSAESMSAELSNLEAGFFRYASYFDAIQLAGWELHQASALDLSHERQSRWSSSRRSGHRLLAYASGCDGWA